MSNRLSLINALRLFDVLNNDVQINPLADRRRAKNKDVFVQVVVFKDGDMYEARRFRKVRTSITQPRG
jgi:hypothetical protein